MGPFPKLGPTLILSLDLISIRLFSVFVPEGLFDRNSSGSELLMWDGNPITHLMPSLSFYWMWILQVPTPHLQVPTPHCRAFHLRYLHLSPESLSPPRSLVHSGGTPPPSLGDCLFPFFLLALRASGLFTHLIMFLSSSSLSHPSLSLPSPLVIAFFSLPSRIGTSCPHLAP